MGTLLLTTACINSVFDGTAGLSTARLNWRRGGAETPRATWIPSEVARRTRGARQSCTALAVRRKDCACCAL